MHAAATRQNLNVAAPDHADLATAAPLPDRGLTASWGVPLVDAVVVVVILLLLGIQRLVRICDVVAVMRTGTSGGCCNRHHRYR